MSPRLSLFAVSLMSMLFVCGCGRSETNTATNLKKGNVSQVGQSASDQDVDKVALYHFGVWSFGGGQTEEGKEWLKSKNHPLYHFGVWSFGGGQSGEGKEWLESKNDPLYHFGVWSFGGGQTGEGKEWLESKNDPLYHFGVWSFGGGQTGKGKEWLKK